MRPVQNAIAILATFCAAGSLLPWSARMRLACAAGAGAMIAVLLVLRLQAHARARERRAASNASERIARIRAARARRFGRR
ncbi:MAG: hypothetical protein ABR591_05165 [Candidatus Velthaea sp.]